MLRPYFFDSPLQSSYNRHNSILPKEVPQPNIPHSTRIQFRFTQEEKRK